MVIVTFCDIISVYSRGAILQFIFTREVTIMLDIRKIKENPDAVKAGLKAKEVDCVAVVDRILELDQ